MTENLTWDDYEEIGRLLYENHADIEPLNARSTDLHDWVCDLDEFDDDPEASTDGKLDAIRMAWLEVWEDEQE